MWETVKLGDLCEVVTKGTTPTSVGFKFESEGINFVKVESLAADSTFINSKFAKVTSECHEALKRSQLKEGDILFSIAGALGRTAIVTEDILPANTNQALAIVRLKENVEVDKRFLLYVLNSQSTREQSDLNKGGVAQQNLSLTQLKNYAISLPPLTEQQSIVAKLDAAFAEIDRSYEFAKEQDGLSRALYENALNDIYLNLEREYPSVRLMELCEKIQDGAHHSPKNLYDEREDGLYPYVTSKNIRTNYMITDSIKYADAEFHNSIYERCNAKFGDVLLTKDGANTGNVCLNEFDEPISLLSSVCLLRGKEGVLLDDYLCFFLQSPIGFKRITGSMTGAAIKRIILKTIKKTKIPLPPIDVQMEMTEKISALLIKIQRLEGVYQKKARELNALKSAILAQELTPPQSAAA